MLLNPDHLFKKCMRDRAQERRTRERPLGLAVFPYVKSTSDRLGRVLQKFRIRTAFKSERTLGCVFRKPEDRPAVNRMAGIVYKVKCRDCSFTYFASGKASTCGPRAEPNMIQAAQAIANLQSFPLTK